MNERVCECGHVEDEHVEGGECTVDTCRCCLFDPEGGVDDE